MPATETQRCSSKDGNEVLPIARKQFCRIKGGTSMTGQPPSTSQSNPQQPSSNQNVAQNFETNERQVQRVSAGSQTNVIQGERNLLINTVLVLLGRQEPDSVRQIQRPITEQLMLEQVKNEVATRLNQS